MTQKEEYDIIRKVLKGDIRSFNTIINSYKNLVFSVINRMIKDENVAEEISQDVFIKLYYSLENFNYNSKLSTYIYRITYNKCVDELRKTKYDHVSDDHFDFLPDNDFNPEIELEEKEIKKIVELSIADLNVDEQLIIEFFYYNKFSVKDIADITDMSISNVKTKLFRIRKKLEKFILEYSNKGVINA